MIVVRPLTAAQVYELWPWIRKGLESTICKTGARARAEDVWLRLRGREPSAYAQVIEQDGERIGFSVICIEHDPDGQVLFLWALWAKPQSLGKYAREVYKEYERIAREIGAVRIRMHSPRKGWERQSFFNKIAVVYEHEVSNV